MTSPPTQLRARSSSSGSDSALSSVSNFFELLHPYDISTDSQSSGLLSYLNADASRMKECREFATELHQSAKKANLVDSALLAKADEISKFKLPDFRIVFVGDMGVGKSSAGNSWLNIEHALRTVSRLYKSCHDCANASIGPIRPLSHQGKDRIPPEKG